MTHLDWVRPVGLGDRLDALERTAVMGIVNVTPDSFSDGGLAAETDDAIAHGLDLAAQGADIVDVGGESTRPGAGRVDAATEAARAIPVVEALAQAGLCVSIDTTRSAVAVAAVEAGARLVNDVSGGLGDRQMLPAVAAAGVPYVCGHWRGEAATMDSLACYDDVGQEVAAELQTRCAALTAAGISTSRIILDPCLGFAKTAQQDWDLLGDLDRLADLGFPILLGASRKRFVGMAVARGRPDTGPLDREAATVAVSAIASARGVWAVRVHSARANLDAVNVGVSWRAAPRNRPPVRNDDDHGLGGC
jgi:dihydropteroate synthase